MFSRWWLNFSRHRAFWPPPPNTADVKNTQLHLRLSWISPAHASSTWLLPSRFNKNQWTCRICCPLTSWLLFLQRTLSQRLITKASLFKGEASIWQLAGFPPQLLPRCSSPPLCGYPSAKNKLKKDEPTDTARPWRMQELFSHFWSVQMPNVLFFFLINPQLR